jgi:ribosomal protein S18 acetylase RimI-like enzyme
MDTPMPFQIRCASPSDVEVMWRMFQRVAAKGDSIPSSEISQEEFVSQWFAPNIHSFVAEADGRLLGMSKLGANHPGRGSHVSSATFIVDPPDQGRGVGRRLVEHSLQTCKRAGYAAMQFNFVVSTNLPALSLYRRLGFTVVGTLPKAFDHSSLGQVDAFVMYRQLGPSGSGDAEGD